jgi:iron complex outermembrane receptor protein
LTLEGKAGFLDASVGVGSPDGRWRVTLFGHNLNNHFYYANLTTADNFIGQKVGNLARDYKRYGGVRLEMKF